ncbi:putative isomerase YbhE [Fistulina hepatica ATCC 64428]|uniref:Putative isomerase YbhE n=1 Tax=Fistulina hepatica ATCC 64428 TaxID=1128425 RepID=A0A0D7AK32_9AGAR|nr:putative isomerase YbhE [Fistulina hepatica ATCC 64428]
MPTCFQILAGGYTAFIAAYSFCTSNSSLDLIDLYDTGDNVSWLSLHPTLPVLYAVNENDAGSLQSFRVFHNGTVSAAIDTVSSGGGSPAFTVALSTGEVAVMNYDDGNGRIFPTTTPTCFDDSAPVITFPVLSGHSHPHMALEYQGEVLGEDTIWRLGRVGVTGNWSNHGSIPQPEGSGPRHIAIHDGYLYTLHELSSTLTVQEMPSYPNGSSPFIANVSIVPPHRREGSKFQAAEILLPPMSINFPVPYIYVSNRNTGTEDEAGDTIAIFEHVGKHTSNSALELVTQFYPGLNQIRGMEFGSAFSGSDEFLVASGTVGGGGVVVMRRTNSGRALEVVARDTSIATRTSFVWLNEEAEF